MFCNSQCSHNPVDKCSIDCNDPFPGSFRALVDFWSSGFKQFCPWLILYDGSLHHLYNNDCAWVFFVSLDPRAKILCGRAFALTGQVSLIDNLISNNNSVQDFGSGRSDFGSYGFSGTPAPVPEPVTMLFLVPGLIGIVGIRRRFRK